MAFKGMTLTRDGQNLLNQAQLSKNFNIKCIRIGDGKYTGNFIDIHNVVNPIYDLATEFHLDGNNLIIDACVNSDDHSGYYLREIALIALDNNKNEIVYAYDNAGDDAEFINPSDNIAYENRLRFCFTITSDINVNVQLNGNIYALQKDMTKYSEELADHKSNKSNPHTVTKSQVGLGNVPNVATNDQIPTYAQATSLTNLVSGEKLTVSLGKIMKAIADLISHIGNKSNPHAVTKSQVGLSNVPNVATNDQAPTYAQATSLTNLVSGEKLTVSLGKIMKAIADLISHIGNKSNPHGVTKSQVGLSNVPNVATNDQAPTYAQATSLTNIVSGEKLTISLGKIMKAIADLISHIGNKSNPHGVTKSQVGLSNVDNTNDLNKPISTATQNALNNKAALSHTHDDRYYTESEVDNMIAQVVTSLDWKESVATYADIAKTYPSPEDGWTVNVKDTDITYRYSGTAWVAISANSIPKATSTVDGLMTKELVVSLSNKLNTTGNASNVVNTFTQATSLTNLVSGEKLTVSLGKIMKAITDLVSHIGNKSNPHAVTKSQVGLGSVPNVATNDQTPTYTQATSLANLVSGEKLTVSLGKIMKAIADLISHIGNKSNPHAVTKSQIGLGNVENKASDTIRSELTKENVTKALGYTPPTTNTTYGLATQNANGLFSSVDKKKLDGVAAGANAYTHPSSHPASIVQVTIGASVVALSEIISCAVFKIAEDDDSVEFGNINEWLTAGKPKL